MKSNSLVNVLFEQEDIKKISNHIEQINKILKGNVINLNAESRKKFGSIGDGNTVFVDKCRSYMNANPDTIPNSVDKEGFEVAYTGRSLLQQPIRELKGVLEKLIDTKILLDYDNYTTSLSYYRYVRFLSGENHPGINTIHDDLKKHFAKSKSNNADLDNNDTGSNPTSS
ncbi:MAG: hypothetical protein OIF50_00645 [Flavobacteriaceae bacterium]|nr:hypothetical protein [Flavobacteriaceae bacterium]